MRKTHFYRLFIFVFLLSLGCGPVNMVRSPVPDSSLQMLLVIGDGINMSTGRMQRFERRSVREAWQPVGLSFPVTLGRQGLAWGRGLHRLAPDHRPRKREGDGRSPAGLFTLGTAFGTDSLSPNLKLDYLPIVGGMEGIDDPASRYYNRIVLRDTVDSPDWRSSEVLSLYPTAYALGVVVNHNTAPVRAGLGSLIFLHVASAQGKPTAGCTAMAAHSMRETAQWLNPAAQPVLAQLPWPWYRTMRLIWKLPRMH